MAVDYSKSALPKGSTKLDRAIARKVARLPEAPAFGDQALPEEHQIHARQCRSRPPSVSY